MCKADLANRAISGQRSLLRPWFDTSYVRSPRAWPAFTVPATSASLAVSPFNRTPKPSAALAENNGLDPGLRSVPNGDRRAGVDQVAAGRPGDPKVQRYSGQNSGDSWSVAKKIN